MTIASSPDVLIVGAGLAGLACARYLHEHGRTFLLLEASDVIGGRVRTDDVDGFLLDRGFQVLLTAYPEARDLLDYGSLDLHSFYSGALVRFGGKFVRVTDPWRDPAVSLMTLFAPIGTFLDKLRIALLRQSVCSGSVDSLFTRPDTTTLGALRTAGFSDEILDRFFRPFFGGVFLDANLGTSNRMFQFVFRMFSEGTAALPARGMQAIPGQLATSLPPGSIRTQTRVTRIEGTGVTLETGERIGGSAVVLATDGFEAARLIPDVPSPRFHSVTCLYFGVDHPLVSAPILVLNGTGKGPINNLCFPNAIAPSYAPPNKTLVSVTVLGDPPDPDDMLEKSVRSQLSDWFGPTAGDWRHLRTYRIPRALPAEPPPLPPPTERDVRLWPGLYVCGDYRATASINGALFSGWRTGEAIVNNLGPAQ